MVLGTIVVLLRGARIQGSGSVIDESMSHERKVLVINRDDHQLCTYVITAHALKPHLLPFCSLSYVVFLSSFPLYLTPLLHHHVAMLCIAAIDVQTDI